MKERPRSIDEQVAREQLGFFQRLSYTIGLLIKGTDDVDELEDLKKRAARAKRNEKFWEEQLK